MGAFWKILELEPTYDILAIKRAYAQKTKTCHPEENPEGFLELRKAYQAAMNYAEQEQGSESLPIIIQEQDESEKEPEEAVSNNWIIPDELQEAGPNPFREGEAIRQFMELYTGNQRRNAKLWMHYFTSDAFLDAAWDSRFTALLLEKVTEVEQDFPFNKEFMMWLGIAYQFFLSEEGKMNWQQLSAEKRERQIAFYQGADFEGMELILRLAAKGPLPKRAGGDELSVLESFKDYRHLVRMAESGSWNEQAMEEFKWIIGRYTSAYIKERYDSKALPDYQRHPAGLRVFIHFFQRDDLPEELYRMVWQKYDLKNVTMGRMKILYGPLRELVTERLSGIEEEVTENFLRLNQDRSAFFARIQANPAQEDEEIEAFFAQENVQKALRSRRFVEEQLLSYSNWMNYLTPESVVYWLKEFYTENQGISGWDQVVERAEQELEYRIEEQNKKEEADEAVTEELDLSLLLRMPYRVFVQPLAGQEHIFELNKGLGKEPEDEEWEDDENGENTEPLTEERLLALFDRFADGELTRLQLQFYEAILVLVRDEDKYACFCFEEGDDIWFSMLSKPEIYRTEDSEDVAYLPFGMGKLAIYNIHESPATIMRNLNLVFMQIGRERIQVRMGNCWLWSSHFGTHNGSFKKRMAMQKLAKIPVRYCDEYILAKFVFSQYPAWVESVSLTGERSLIQIKPGSSDLAVAALVQFFGKKLAKLRLSWGSKGQKDKTGQRHMILLQDGGQFMMAWLEDDKEQAKFYASDAPRIFLGRVYPACLVHQGLGRIRNCFDLIMDDMTCAEFITSRSGEFVPVDCPYIQIRNAFVDEMVYREGK